MAAIGYMVSMYEYVYCPNVLKEFFAQGGLYFLAKLLNFNSGDIHAKFGRDLKLSF